MSQRATIIGILVVLFSTRAVSAGFLPALPLRALAALSPRSRRALSAPTLSAARPPSANQSSSSARRSPRGTARISNTSLMGITPAGRPAPASIVAQANATGTIAAFAPTLNLSTSEVPPFAIDQTYGSFQSAWTVPTATWRAVRGFFAPSRDFGGGPFASSNLTAPLASFGFINGHLSTVSVTPEHCSSEPVTGAPLHQLHCRLHCPVRSMGEGVGGERVGGREGGREGKGENVKRSRENVEEKGCVQRGGCHSSVSFLPLCSCQTMADGC
ncbi:unnamed protein product [Closterium sp. Naga37s-1]|nr:unnamed protein product [Closterium sp. Naga37s-1]